MPIAAVPLYLQKDDSEFYLSAPPGHRFLLYFSAWGDNQETNKVDWRMQDRVPKIDKKTGKQKIGKLGPEWDDLPNDQYACSITACKTPAFDDERPRRIKPKADPGLKPWQPLMKGLLDRQTAFVATSPDESILRLDAIAVSPFTTGLGNEHPLENGFAFLNPYGLPYLPGSGVKGVLRQAARELASGDWGDAKGWTEDKNYSMRIDDETVNYSMLDALFGLESDEGETVHIRGALSFWDVIPQIKGDSLMIEIMTPHQEHYYQQKAHAGSTNPHESGQTNPISYLTVPPGSGFTFHVICDLAHLRRLAPDLAENGKWKDLLHAAFEHAFEWLGFGAKTAVGYGAMKVDKNAEARLVQERQAQETARQAEDEKRRAEEAARAALEAEEKRLASLSPLERSIEEVLKKDTDPGKKDFVKLLEAMRRGVWTGEDRSIVAQRIKTEMQKLSLWKEASTKKNPDKDREYQRTLEVMKFLNAGAD